MVISMGFAPEYLMPLPEDRIQRMYGDATAREGVFRNVLIDLADNETETTLFKTATIDDIFEKYVRINGYVTRIGDYKLGPSQERITPLTAEELLIFIQTSGHSGEKVYQILENDQVKFVRNGFEMMH